MSTSAAIALLATLAGCVTRHRVVVRGTSLHRAAPALAQTGRATVEAEDLRDDAEAGKRFPIELAIDQPVGAGDERKPVRDWIVDCTAPGRCGLQVIGDAPLEVRRYETRSARPVIAGTTVGLVAGTLVASVICGLACAEGSDAKRYSKYALIGEGVIVGAGLVWVLISCFGSRSCRD